MPEDVDTYIRENRDRFTREAITRHLLETGFTPEEVEGGWTRAGPIERPPGLNMTTPVWIVFLLAVGGILVLTGLGLGGLGLLWLAVFGLVLAWPLAKLAAARPQTLDGAVRVVLGTVLLVLFVGVATLYGTCLAVVKLA